jgi:hypothetical protein
LDCASTSEIKFFVLDPCLRDIPQFALRSSERFELVASNWLYRYQEWTKASWGPHVPAVHHTRTMRDEDGEEQEDEEDEELRAVRTMMTIWPLR